MTKQEESLNKDLGKLALRLLEECVRSKTIHSDDYIFLMTEMIRRSWLNDSDIKAEAMRVIFDYKNYSDKMKGEFDEACIRG